MPLYVSQMPDVVIQLSAMALVGTLVLFLFVKAEPLTRKRLALCALAIALIVGARVYADTAIDPCRICQGITPDDWRYWLWGCWGCGLDVRREKK